MSTYSAATVNISSSHQFYGTTIGDSATVIQGDYNVYNLFATSDDRLRLSNNSDSAQILLPSRSTIFKHNPIFEHSSQIIRHPPASHIQAISYAHQSISRALETALFDTQAVVRSSDTSLRRWLAAALRDLRQAENHLELLGKQYETRKAQEQDTILLDVFFDCVSRIPNQPTNTSTHNLKSSLLGAPTYRFESLPTFCPEKYSSRTIAGACHLIRARKSRTRNDTVHYFTYYGLTARCWRRVMVSATFHAKIQRRHVMEGFDFGGPVGPRIHSLPPALKRLIEKLLPRISMDSWVTQISLDLGLDEDGRITVWSPRLDVVSNNLEVSREADRKFIEHFSTIGLRSFAETELAVCARLRSASYIVCCESRQYVEHRVPFATLGSQGLDAYREFLEEIDHRCILRGIPGVADLRGVVLDDTRNVLRGYLLDQPLVYLEAFIAYQNRWGQQIPLPIRVFWARQYIEALTQIHQRNLVAGAHLWLNCVVGRDGNARFHQFRRSSAWMRNRNGFAPPEFRNLSWRGFCLKGLPMTRESDIFQLGLLLWLLMEHQYKYEDHYRHRFGDGQSPQSTSTANCVNPVELPECHNGTPPYLREVIRRCRSPDPDARITAIELHEILERTENPVIEPAEIDDCVQACVQSGTALAVIVWCSNCASLTTERHFSCRTCQFGDFDLCPECISMGHHCFDKNHVLIECRLVNNEFHDCET